MLWTDIEKVGREKYKLGDEWHLCGADASDPEIMHIEFGKKGPRGGWLQGKENRFKGSIIYNQEQRKESHQKAKVEPEPEQLQLF